MIHVLFKKQEENKLNIKSIFILFCLTFASVACTQEGESQSQIQNQSQRESACGEVEYLKAVRNSLNILLAYEKEALEHPSANYRDHLFSRISKKINHEAMFVVAYTASGCVESFDFNFKSVPNEQTLDVIEHFTVLLIRNAEYQKRGRKLLQSKLVYELQVNGRL